MNPASGPATPVGACVRLEQSLTRFESEYRACAETGGTIANQTFGAVLVADYARFIELHTRHHCKQMPDARNDSIQ